VNRLGPEAAKINNFDLYHARSKSLILLDGKAFLSKGDPWLFRIQSLTDEEGGGRRDIAVTFADYLDRQL